MAVFLQTVCVVHKLQRERDREKGHREIEVKRENIRRERERVDMREKES